MAATEELTNSNEFVAANGDARECVYQAAIDRMRISLNDALRGKREVVELVLACLLARGHLLIEDIPGLGKTTIAKALAAAVGGKFARMQCTPDLLPGDITGFNIFNQKTREFEFLPGPVFADVLLADEINRATPRTQSALFEAMAERQVTVDNCCRHLSEGFFVIATQNPIEQHGTYPLPEAQLDRFAIKLSIGYPDPENECEMLAAHVGTGTQVRKVATADITPEQLLVLQRHIESVAVADSVRRYLIDVAWATRRHAAVTLPISPRGVLIWQRMGQAWAHLRGRDFTTPDDFQEVAPHVLGVRLSGDFSDPGAIIAEILETVPVPVA
ncbi:ATPase family associated with various cellular activities (AAA) [Planctomycetes bacterium Pan216]|uniref:ATPase family associated with various cellular activities (AAA) n=1 Tax=Kolteria novifilia TaxID=2527975 RepID=A0A518BBD8_9BACT|nr:ATPase family associated with various cellular activities (AAA) [Planctomycetes bacterium Pan216]